jgi:hypothetical protein
MQKENKILQLKIFPEAVSLHNPGQEKALWAANLLGCYKEKQTEKLFLDRLLDIPKNAVTECGFTFDGAISTILTRKIN